jgi:hypothetical protein
MLPKRDYVRIGATWDRGGKAVVHLIECSSGAKLIRKTYNPRYIAWMFRECFSAFYLSRRLDVVPHFVSFRPWRRELVVSYIHGQRVLEWVLEHFGQADLDVSEFRNYDGIQQDVRVMEAFDRFRKSTSAEAIKLNRAIIDSYAKLHGLGWQHGSVDPRNLIYDGQCVYIIDFDHARPSLRPTKYDSPALKGWFGTRYPVRAGQCTSNRARDSLEIVNCGVRSGEPSNRWRSRDR